MVYQSEKFEIITTKDSHQLKVGLHFADNARANVIFVHGLAGDMNEVDNLFVKASTSFYANGMNTIRFDFRGHGSSDMNSEDMTLAGELLDLSAIVDYLEHNAQLPFVFVGASLGAISVLRLVKESPSIWISSIALWNPVLDCRAVFIDPGTSWSQSTFQAFSNDPHLQHIEINGFKVGRKFWEEIQSSEFTEVNVPLPDTLPCIVFHGTSDEIVPYGLTETIIMRHPTVELHSFKGQGHGLRGVQSQVIDETIKWVKRNFNLVIPASRSR
jgi:pimeloyl-ACP methyl ester carboxylesterase